MTCGAAMEVPSRATLPPPSIAESICSPGAWISTHSPRLEKPDCSSARLLAATVITRSAEAGETVQASAAELPAAMTGRVPDSATAVAALFTASERLPPRETFRTAGCLAFCATQSSPATTAEYSPRPSQPSTRTLTRRAARATPCVRPPTVPATCVPWPSQSRPSPPSPTASNPGSARPSNSAWS